MRVVEHFLSIQGEGAYAGRLAIFIRLAGCNLRCKGFGVKLKSPKTGELLLGCDTIRAVQTAHFSHQNLNAKELADIISGYAKDKHQRPIVIITGGEPLLWQNDKDFALLLSWLSQNGFCVHFETNGTIAPDFKGVKELRNCHFAISVKLAFSGESEAKRINENSLKSIQKNASSAFFKFVLKGEKKELDEVAKISSLAPALDVWLMPLASNQSELASRAKGVAELAISLGYNYCDRLHIRLYNDKEGV